MRSEVRSFTRSSAGCRDSPVQLVGDVDVALRSGQQEHDEGVLQVTLTLHCLETHDRKSERGRPQPRLQGTVGKRGRTQTALQMCVCLYLYELRQVVSQLVVTALLDPADRHTPDLRVRKPEQAQGYTQEHTQQRNKEDMSTEHFYKSSIQQ